MTECGLYRRINHWDLREEKTAKTTPHLSDRVRQGKKHVLSPSLLRGSQFFPPPSQVCLASPLSLKIPYMFIQGGSLTLLFLLPTQEYVNGNRVTSLSLSSLDFISVPNGFFSIHRWRISLSFSNSSHSKARNRRKTPCSSLMLSRHPKVRLQRLNKALFYFVTEHWFPMLCFLEEESWRVWLAKTFQVITLNYKC